jgi:hypothetical protein
MARKVDETANFVFVELNLTVLGGTKQTWHGKEFPIGWRSLVCVYTYITKTYNRIQIQNVFHTQYKCNNMARALCYKSAVKKNFQSSFRKMILTVLDTD